MKYLGGSFTLPAGSNKISQKMWDRAFPKEKVRKKKLPKKKIHPALEPLTHDIKFEAISRRNKFK